MSIGDQIRDGWAGWIGRHSRVFSRRRLVPLMKESLGEHVPAGAAAGTVLNIGAGGEIEVVLHGLRVEFTSVDIDPDRKPDLVMNIENLDGVATGSVRAVVLMEVLEHVRRPHLAVAELERVLQPGGVVIGSTPFILGIHDEPHDHFRYTVHGLENLFAGFEKVWLEARDGYFGAMATLCVRWLKRGADRRDFRTVWLAPVLLPLTWFFALLDRWCPGGDATTGYFFVFRRR